MCEYLRKIAKKLEISRLTGLVEGEFRKFKKAEKRSILAIFILVVTTGLFFSVFSGEKATAKKMVQSKRVELATVDPLEKVGQGFIKNQEIEKICLETAQQNEQDKSLTMKKEKYLNLIQNHPMEDMVGALLLKDENVTAFLIGIAKKESDWGKHSPKKNGRECFNYWGYKGGYNVTESGYSCFDSPEQAVDVVGGRIEKLISQKVNTPEKMIVWKCGSTCAGHDPISVRKWISDVSQYYNKLKI